MLTDWGVYGVSGGAKRIQAHGRVENSVWGPLGQLVSTEATSKGNEVTWSTFPGLTFQPACRQYGSFCFSGLLPALPIENHSYGPNATSTWSFDADVSLSAHVCGCPG